MGSKKSTTTTVVDLINQQCSPEYAGIPGSLAGEPETLVNIVDNVASYCTLCSSVRLVPYCMFLHLWIRDELKEEQNRNKSRESVKA